MLIPWTLTEALSITKAAVEVAGGETIGRWLSSGSPRMVIEEPLLVKLRTVTCSA